jgi:hypothetical protein
VNTTEDTTKGLSGRTVETLLEHATAATDGPVGWPGLGRRIRRDRLRRGMTLAVVAAVSVAVAAVGLRASESLRGNDPRLAPATLRTDAVQPDGSLTRLKILTPTGEAVPVRLDDEAGLLELLGPAREAAVPRIVVDAPADRSEVAASTSVGFDPADGAGPTVFAGTGPLGAAVVSVLDTGTGPTLYLVWRVDSAPPGLRATMLTSSATRADSFACGLLTGRLEACALPGRKAG